MAIIIGNIDKSSLPSSIINAVGSTSSKRYGIKFTDLTTAGTGVRTYDAANLNFTPSTATLAGSDDFISVAPFNIKECITQYNSSTGKREVLAYEGDSNWSSLVSAKTGDRMIEFPSFYYKRPSRYEWVVSTDPISGFSPSPMHYRNGVMHSTARVSKYALNSSYVSQTGTSPLVSTTLQTFRTNLRAKGQYVMDYATYSTINMLMAIKYGTLNMQSKIGVGWSDVSTTSRTTTTSGATDTIKGKDGTVSRTSTIESILCMGIENYYGHIWKFVDGYIKIGQGIYINTDIENISDWPASSDAMTGYTKAGTAIYGSQTDSRGYCGTISELAYDSTYPWAAYPSNCSANINDNSGAWTNYCVTSDTTNSAFLYDGWWYDGSSVSPNMRIGLVGGSLYFGSLSGPFALLSSGPLAFSSTNVGALSLELG